MRTKSTPWNRSYQVDEFTKSLRKHRTRGTGKSTAQQKAFRIHEEPKKPQELPEDWKAIGDKRKRAMEKLEDKRLREELREVWE